MQREELEDGETDQPEAELENANGILEKAYNMTAKNVLAMDQQRIVGPD